MATRIHELNKFQMAAVFFPVNLNGRSPFGVPANVMRICAPIYRAQMHNAYDQMDGHRFGVNMIITPDGSWQLRARKDARTLPPVIGNAPSSLNRTPESTCEPLYSAAARYACNEDDDDM